VTRHEGTKARRHEGVAGRAFTIVELLVVIGIVIVLVGLLIVAVRAATRSAQGANTRALMSSIKQALVRFQGDVGYLPPVLGDPSPDDLSTDNHDLRRLFDPRGQDLRWNGSADEVMPQYMQAGNGAPAPNHGTYIANVQNWYSVTTLAEYLLGYGHHEQDGWGITPNSTYTGEVPATGIRNPDRDGVWGATIYDRNNNGVLGELEDRMGYPGRGGAVPANVDRGQVLGPYLELKDERAIAAVDWNEDEDRIEVIFPGSPRYDPELPKTIVDYWGNPIRYYRRVYAPGSLATPYTPPRNPTSTTDVTHTPTLSDVFVLRPYEVADGAAIDDRLFPDGRGDTTTSSALQSAMFALLSAGPDNAIDPADRVDPGFLNEDNLVELGP